MKWDTDRLHRYTCKGGEISKVTVRARVPASLPSQIHISALTSHEDAYRLLKENQSERFRLRACDGLDDARHDLHPMQFAPGPHLAPSDMFQLGVTYHKETKPLEVWHDLTHLKAGNMVDNRAYVRK